MENSNSTLVQNLINRFEDDFRFGMESTGIIFGRSEARIELETQGVSILPSIWGHLLPKKTTEAKDKLENNIRLGWAQLLANIGHQNKLPNMPETIGEFDKWIDWIPSVID